MNGRLVAAAALLVAAVGASGCIEALSSLASSEGEVTAMANRDLADGAARAWNPTAELRAVFAVETANLTEEYPADPAIGNGRAPLWVYGYAADNETQHRAFHVTADGQVRAINGTLDDFPGMGEAVGEWRIDSDRALEIARGEEAFRAVVESEGAAVMDALGAEDGTTAWAIVAGTPERQAIVILDAVDGTVLVAESMDLAFSMPAFPGMAAPGGGPQVEMADEGTLDADTPTKELPFSIRRADVGILQVEIAKTLPTDALGWRILDAQGDAVAEGVLRTSNMEDRRTFDFTLDAPGDYVLELSYRAMLAPLGSVDYDLLLVVGPPTEVDVDVSCC